MHILPAPVTTHSGIAPDAALYAVPSTREALLALEQTAMEVLRIVQQKHAAETSALKELRALRRSLAPITALALCLPAERGPVVALLRAFIAATQWETRAALARNGDPWPSIVLRLAGQMQMTRLALQHEREQTKIQRAAQRAQRLDASPSAARSPPARRQPPRGGKPRHRSN